MNNFIENVINFQYASQCLTHAKLEIGQHMACTSLIHDTKHHKDNHAVTKREIPPLLLIITCKYSLDKMEVHNHDISQVHFIWSISTQNTRLNITLG